MNILVTGSEGFIGSHLTSKLISENYNVITVDKINNKKEKHYTSCILKLNLSEIINKHQIDWVFHLAAETAFNLSDNEYIKNNIKVTKYLIESLNQIQKKPRVTFTSSMAVNKPGTFISIDDCRPNTKYGESKFICENIIKSYHGKWHILRPTTVWGPNVKYLPEGLWKYLRLGIPCTVSAKTYRHYIYVEDLMKCLQNFNNKKIEYATDFKILVKDQNYNWSKYLFDRNRMILLPYSLMHILAIVGPKLVPNFPLTKERLFRISTSEKIPQKYIQKFEPIDKLKAYKSTKEWLSSNE